MAMKNTTTTTVSISGVDVPVVRGDFVIVDVTSPMTMPRAGRIYAVSKDAGDLAAIIDDLRRKTKIWLQLAQVA